MDDISRRLRPRPIPLLPIANRGSQLGVGADSLKANLSEVCRAIEHLEPANPVLGLRHRTNVFALGATRFCVLAHDPLRFACAAQTQPSLVIPFRGRFRFTVAGQQFLATGGRTAFWWSGDALRGELGKGSALILLPEPARLRAAVDREEDALPQTSGFGPSRVVPFSFTHESPRAPALARLLEEMGRSLERPELASLLGLEDLFYRWMADILKPPVNAGRARPHPE